MAGHTVAHHWRGKLITITSETANHIQTDTDTITDTDTNTDTDRDTATDNHRN